MVTDKNKHWKVELGITDKDCKIFYGYQMVGFVQKVEIEAAVHKTTSMKLTIVDPKIKINGVLEEAKVQTEVVCPECEEAKRIENKSW